MQRGDCFGQHHGLVSKVKKIAFLGDYLPRKCGIATFTPDVLSAVATEFPKSQCFAVPVNDVKGGYEYPREVRFEIEEQDLSSYLRTADFLNISNADVLCVQHEFGIYGGPSGSHLLALLRELRMPIVTTLHTVLLEPNPEQRRVMQELIARSTRLVVMAERGKQMLLEVYQAPPTKIDLIPHGIPDMSFVDPNFYKDQFGVEGRLVLLTFGLLSPNKGIEHVLNALPAIVAEFPNIVYIVLGATHPNLVREHGETYRLSLERLAKKNKVEKHVIFYNRFVELEELKEFIGAADIYITPYLNEAQITSGTLLAYAFGAGKAVVSTPYWHAAELLAEERGVLVPFGDAKAIAHEVIGLLRDENRRTLMRKNAYKLGREMIWSNVGRQYMKSFELARLEGAVQSRKSFATKTLDQAPRALPELKLDYLQRLSGDRFAEQIREALLTRLMELFDRTATPEWAWFEDVLSYDNAKLAHALIVSGHATKQAAVLERGLQSLRWLVKMQSAESGDFRPIGSNGFHARGGSRADFDQQPIERRTR